MSENTLISWSDATFNPWIGCTEVSPGCLNCFARRDFDTRKHVAKWGPGNPRHRTGIDNWLLPTRWNKVAWAECKSCGTRAPLHRVHLQDGECWDCGSRLFSASPRRVFCGSLCDVFDNEVDPQWRVDLLELIARCDNLEWLLLTKRVVNAHRMLDEALGVLSHGLTRWDDAPWPHVTIGQSVCNQKETREIEKLLALPASRRFISVEPMLSEIDVRPYLRGPVKVDWVIAGGESGPHARPMHPEWIRSLAEQCREAGVPFHFKQWGVWKPESVVSLDDLDRDVRMSLGVDGSEGMHAFGKPGTVTMRRVGTKRAGCELDGQVMKAFPQAGVPA